MPIEFQDGWEDSFIGEPSVRPPARPSTGDVYGAAFRQENDVLAMVELLTRDKHKPDTEWDFTKRLRRSPYYTSHADTLAAAESESEMLAIEERIGKELKDRQTLASAGWSGLVAAMVAGTLSPTVALPVAGAARGAKGAATAFGYAALGGVGQEGVLLAAQETRTIPEAAAGVAMQTVIGGLLGTAAVALRPKELDAIARRMAVSTGETSILPAAPRGSVGATVAENPVEGAGRLRDGDRWYMRTLAKIGPVTETINSWLSVPSREMAKLDDAGVFLEGYGKGQVAAEGGTVSARITRWNGPTSRALRYNDQAYAKYTQGDSRAAVAKAHIANFFPGMARRAGIIPRDEWNRRVADAFNDIEGREKIPEIEQVAEFYRAELFDKLGEVAVKQGMYKGIKELEDFVALGENKWLTRVYNENAIRAQQDTWIRMWQAHIEKKLVTKFRDDFTKIGKQDKLAQQDIDDLMLPREIAEKEILRIQQELEAKDASNPFTEVEDAIAALREQRKGTTGAERRELSKQATALKTPDLEEAAAERGALRRRLRTLRRGRGNIERRRAEALDTIERLEEQNLDALKRMLRTGQRLLAKAERLSDERFDAQVEKLQTTLEREAAAFAKREKKIEKLIGERDLEEFFAETSAAPAAPVRPTPEPVRQLKKGEQTEWEGATHTLVDATGQRWVLQRGVLQIDQRSWGIAPVDENYKQIGEIIYGGDSKAQAIASIEEGRFNATQVQPSGLPSRYARLVEETQEVTPDFGGAEAKQAQLERIGAQNDTAIERMKATAERLNDLEGASRETQRAAVQDAIDALAERIQGTNARRVQREVKLRQKVDELDPQRALDEAEGIKERMGQRTEDFIERMRTVGVGDYELGKGEFDFSDAALRMAQKITQKILGQDKSRMVGVDWMIGAERGSLLPRMLDMPIETPGFREFLERDIDKLSRIYVRHMAPDVEMHRATGSVNGAKAIDKMQQEFVMRQDQILQDIGPDGRALTKPRTQEQKNKALAELEATFKRDLHNYEVVVSRLRNQRGVPGDATSFFFRAGKVARNLNTLRLMGTVAISSVADIGRPVMKYGLTRTFRDAWVPFIRSFTKDFDYARIKELTRFSGTGNDALMHSRSQLIADALDDYEGGTVFERGLNWLSNRMGMIALFDPWTQTGKYLSGSVVNSLLWDSLEAIHRGGRLIPRAKAQEFLDSVGITDRIGKRMLDLVEAEGGGEKGRNGRWLPNAEDWTGDFADEAQWAYQSAMNKAIDDTIITPGPERPKWVDENEAFRMVAQFRSFALSSTTKMLMAGLQQRDMAVLNGAMVSLAMGAVSYYIWALTTGGKALEEMLEAGPDKWADEAIDRSGLLGVFAEARRVGERIPYVNDAMTFSGERTTRRAGEDIVAAALGPSFDLAKRGSNVIVGLDDPTQSTVHNLRVMWPLQNVWWLRQGFDAVESGVNNTFGIPRERTP